MDVDEQERPQPEAEEPQPEGYGNAHESKLDHHTIGEVNFEGGQVGGRYGTSVGQPSICYTPFNSSTVKTVLINVYVLKIMYY